MTSIWVPQPLRWCVDVNKVRFKRLLRAVQKWGWFALFYGELKILQRCAIKRRIKSVYVHRKNLLQVFSWKKFYSNLWRKFQVWFKQKGSFIVSYRDFVQLGVRYEGNPGRLHYGLKLVSLFKDPIKFLNWITITTFHEFISNFCFFNNYSLFKGWFYMKT